MIDLDSGRVATPCPTCDLLPLVWAWSPDGRDLAAPARRDGEDWKAARYWRFSARGQATLLSSTVSVGVGGRFLPESGVAWPGRDPIVLGRTASAPRLDWWRLTAKGPVNLTAGASGVLSQIPATASGSVLLRTLSGLVSVRGDTPPRSAPGRPIETAPPLGGRTGQAVVVEAPTGAALVDADGATRPLPDLPPSTRVLALAPRAGAVLGETRDAHGVRTLVLSRPGLADRPLTTINAALAAVDFSAPIPIHHKGAAGQALTSWLYLPPDGADRPDLPVIVVPYPGTTYVQPMAEEGPGELKFDANIPLMTANGYAVIVPSLPLALDKEPMAGLADAMLAIVDQARINHPNLSGKRLAVWGQSYGGYGALAAGVESPRFQAIIATAPVTNLIARHAPLPGVAMAMPETFLQIASRLRWAETGQGRMGVPPWTDPDRYVRNSPALQVDKITAPVMLVVGDLDSDPGQVRAMFASLYRLGKDAQLLEYRGEQHVMISPGNVRDLYARAFAFLRDALGDEPGGTAKPEAIRPSQ
jgi:dipeptidyl aminopeptidase/acylaminoacyl peptidase